MHLLCSFIIGVSVIYNPALFTTTARGTKTSSSIEAPTEAYNLVFINSSKDWAIHSNDSLGLGESFSFSFKTCFVGVSSLLYEAGDSGDAFEIALNGSEILLRYNIKSQPFEKFIGRVDQTLISWHTFYWNVSEERIDISISTKDSDWHHAAPDAEFESRMRKIDLRNSSTIRFGSNFTGCLLSGLRVDFTRYSVANASCPLDYIGCDEGTKAGECDIHSCQNNGTCQAHPSRCLCSHGYKGRFCDAKMDSCSDSPCANGGTCIPGSNNFTCTCPKEIVNLTQYTEGKKELIYTVGYNGEFCESPIDACRFDPGICMKGKCSRDDSATMGFQCHCPQGKEFYVGTYCQIRTDICKVSTQCSNGATCTPLGGDKFNCSCLLGFTGKLCEIDIDECLPNPCQHNGTCLDLVNSFKCSCLNGTAGNSCQININECASNPCHNGGKCNDLINEDLSDIEFNDTRFECNCSNTGYVGSNCEIDIDECFSSPCKNGATCGNLVNNYTCHCYPGYNGSNCEFDIDECISSSCLNNATCIQNSLVKEFHGNYSLHDGYTCRCPPGYSGEHCGTEIDECISSPCQFGNCTDKVNSFSCFCNPGYKGILCELEIDECQEYEPCMNNATCIDSLNDYFCKCSDETLLGGKNCSVTLVGCQHDICANGTICKPLLIDESTNNHGYQCICPRGFRGPLCEIDTSLSFYKNSSLFIPLSPFNSASLRFKTTLSQVLLLTYISSGDEFLLTLQLSRGVCLEITSYTFIKNDTVFNKNSTSLCLPKKMFLNSSKWNSIKVEFNRSTIFLQLFDSMCIKASCFVFIENISSEFMSKGSLYFGSLLDRINTSSPFFPTLSSSMPNYFAGCIDELKLGGDWIRNELNDSVSRGVVNGCLRTVQCERKCRNNGSCVDLWNDFKCNCIRPYYGTTCSEYAEAATFGKDFVPSYAVFNVSKIFRPSDLAERIEVTMFFRTRESHGLLFLILFDESLDNYNKLDNKRFLSVEISSNNLLVRAKFFNGSQHPEVLYDSESNQFTDGQQHFLRIYCNYSSLQLYVDGNLRRSLTVNISEPLLERLSTVYVGGIKDPIAISKRDTSSKVHPSTINTSYIGTIQDLRINNVLLAFQLSNTTWSASPLTPSDSANLMPGETTSDVCTVKTPCDNNGSCTNVFFNDYNCECTASYKGRECQALKYCFSRKCPVGSCLDIQDGFECVTVATFSPTSSASYLIDVKGTGLNTLRWKGRTRSEKFQLIDLRNVNETLNCAVVEFDSNKLKLRINGMPAAEISLKEISGNWFDVNITFSSTSVSISSSLNLANNSPKPFQYNTSCLISLDQINVTLVPGNGSMSNFKGCISEVQINGMNLPFFNATLLPNVTSHYDKFLDVILSNVTTGSCNGDQVCQPNPCTNDGKCVDHWNNYSCSCVTGFEGENCQVDTNHCSANNCTNNSTCVSKVNLYECLCQFGYSGSRCEIPLSQPPVLSKEQLTGIIVGTVGGALLVVAISLFIGCCVKLKSRRAKHGVYNPSMEEATGASVQFNDALKIPPEERLI